ncbi:MAG: fibronectin type III domain-containing protein [Gemmatimonadetes bacterium]|nr:fibronectin type III domain-containing protein [Gemmatimonadota bacterium]MBT6149372.1 fibronectin type III domain-containing protein [Gemmatimonadota bacterium]MBT7860645.1 fibronectin type III domain-containing protein [Gemmatimonadota bacterium]
MLESTRMMAKDIGTHRHLAIWMFALTALTMAACSNDTDLPARYHEDLLAQPTDVESTLDSGDLTVTWQMSTTTNVDGFVVSLTDTSGAEETHFVGDASATVYEEASAQLTSGTFYIIRLWAVDDIGFFGPTSTPDTLVVP